MKKLFISADIEGTTGITHWDETEKGKGDYPYFADQMTREVNAACEGAKEGGFDFVTVKDAHDSARNLNPRGLPEYTEVIRGWCSHPYCMMYGIDKTYAGAVFTGYHSAAQMNTNPLSHTMNLGQNSVFINGALASELMINCLTAAYESVPVLAVTGDKGLCDWIQAVNPNILTVPVNEGHGGGVTAMHPDKAVRLIKETVARACRGDASRCMFPLPGHFDVEISYKEHRRATEMSFYPGAGQKDERTITYSADDWFDVLRFFQFVM